MNDQLLNIILDDMHVELFDEFDQNFSRGGFFGSAWKRKITGEASNLIGTGKLRRSLAARKLGAAVVFSSSEPYAQIHNDGGEIVVTPKMRKFFWAQYYKNGKRGAKAEMYKNLALKQVGSAITIPQRQFIGDHEKVRACIQQIVSRNIEQSLKASFDNLKKTKK